MRRGLAAFLLALITTRGLSALGLSVDFGWGGRSVPGRWVPLRLSVDGGPRDALIEVTRLDPEGREGPTESFRPEGQGPVECPVYVDPASTTLRVRLLSGKEVLAERLIQTLAKSFPGHVVLAVDLPDTAHRGLALALEPLEPVLAVKVDARALPSLALDLDAVAGIAMRDTGNVLSPARKEALLSWLASGGRVLVLGARPGGLGEALGCPAPAEGGRSFAAMGHGAIVALSAPLPSPAVLGDASFWRRELGLEPFGGDLRISAGRLARVMAPASRVPSPLFALDPLLGALAAAWVLSMVLLLRRGRGALLACLVSAALAIGALPAAKALDASRLGLSHASSRVLILPNGALLADSSVSALKPSWTLDLSSLVPPRSLSFRSQDGEKGRLGPGASSPGFVHPGPIAASSILRASPASAELVAMTGPRPSLPPPSPAAFAMRTGSPIVLVRGGRPGFWYLPSEGGWTESRLEPAFLSWDSAWVAVLRDEYPGYDFVVGRADAGRSSPTGLAELRPTIEGGSAPTLLWAVAYLRAPGEAWTAEAGR